jgi:ketosteroid isomerase-like protein
MTGNGENRRALLDDRVVVHTAKGLPYSGEYRSPEEFFALLSAMRELLVLTPGPISHHTLTDEVVAAIFNLTFTARTSGDSVESRVVELYTVREGRIVDLDVYYKDPSAVAALLGS